MDEQDHAQGGGRESVRLQQHERSKSKRTHFLAKEEREERKAEWGQQNKLGSKGAEGALFVPSLRTGRVHTNTAKAEREPRKGKRTEECVSESVLL